MALEIFTGDHLPTLLTRIRAALGPEACVVQLRRRGTAFELIASDGTGEFAPHDAIPVRIAAHQATPDFRELLAAEIDRPVTARPATPEPVAVPTPMPVAAPAPPARPAFMARPWMVALVGPTGTGKTTTIAKLATNRLGFGGCRVGLLGLDTYRVGAVQQLETYADLADVSVEIVYQASELSRAVARLNQCEVVLIDTPGRGPRNSEDAETIRGWLRELAPDEVHLTLAAGQLPAITRRLLRSYAGFGITHLLATKHDEFPAEAAVFDLAVEQDRRMRWVTDGQEVPADLRTAADLVEAARHRFELDVLPAESIA